MKMTPSIAGAMSGSIGGLTASRNRGGAYFRRRAVPTNPNSGNQQTIRAAFGGLVQAWSTLSESDRIAWTNYAANTPRVDTLGQALVLTGQQSFIGCNSARQQANAQGLRVGDLGPAPIVLTGPDIFNTGEGIGSVDSFGIATTSGPADGCFLAGTFAAPLTGTGRIFFFIGRPVSSGVNFFKGPYSLAGSTQFNEGDGSFEFINRFNTPEEWCWPNVASPQALQVVASATDTLTLAGADVFANLDEVVIGGQTYVIQTVLVDAPNNVLRGANGTTTMANLVKAITAGVGAGTAYGTGTVANAFVTATSAAQVLTVEALVSGRGGNSIGVSTTSETAVWATSNLTGGADTQRYPVKMVMSYDDGRYSQAFQTIQTATDFR